MDSINSPSKAFLLKTSLTMGKWYDKLYLSCMISFNFYIQITGPYSQAHRKYIAGMAKKAIQAKPTEFHRLLRILDDCGLLKRLYSQNIDGLEAKVGFDTFATDNTRKCVLLHGNLATLRCDRCTCLYMLENYLSFLECGESIHCPECIQRREQDNALGKRLRAPGHLRPNILLYNSPCTEEEEIADLAMKDIRSLHESHVLLIGGTSLQIPGIKLIIQTFKDAMFKKNLLGCEIIYVDITSNSPSVLPESMFHVQMDCQKFATKAISKLQHHISDENEQSDKNRRDFRPFWDWN